MSAADMDAPDPVHTARVEAVADVLARTDWLRAAHWHAWDVIAQQVLDALDKVEAGHE